jgi:secreted trypsin-like serine protease
MTLQSHLNFCQVAGLGQERQVSDIVTKNYDEENYENDFALLKLKLPVTVTSSVKPVCLPTKKDELFSDRPMTVSGWGDTEETENSPAYTLRYLHVISVKNLVCKTFYSSIITKNKICARAKTMTTEGICFGDFGGKYCQYTNIFIRILS